MTSQNGVIAELDLLIKMMAAEDDRFSAGSLMDIRSKVSALVGAARVFDQADLFEENSAYMRAQVTVSVGQLRILSRAIKELEHG